MTQAELWRRWVAACGIWCALLSAAFGQARQVAADRAVVDIVTLNSREQLRGAVLGRDEQGQVLMAVQRDWLRKQYPKLLETVVADEQARQLDAAKTAVTRLKQWHAEDPEPGTLRAFVTLELERAEKRLKQVEQGQAESPQFLWLTFPAARVRVAFTQPPPQRALAALAWRERLERVENREADDLRKELAAKDVSLTEVANLADRLPQLPQDDREWTARRALVEFHFGTKHEYQGFGQAFFKTGENAPPVELGQLLPQLLEKQLQDQLGDLLNDAPKSRDKARPSDALKRVTDEVAASGGRAVRVTQLDLDLATQRATVTTRFLAKLPGDRWEVIWEAAITEDGTRARPELEQRIARDPRLKEVKDALAGLGIEQQLNSAIRVGAATMAAQESANQQFFRFRDTFVIHLDAPPLRWSNSNNR